MNWRRTHGSFSAGHDTPVSRTTFDVYGSMLPEVDEVDEAVATGLGSLLDPISRLGFVSHKRSTDRSG